MLHDPVGYPAVRPNTPVLALRGAVEAGSLRRPHGPHHQWLCRDRELAELHRTLFDSQCSRWHHQDRQRHGYPGQRHDRGQSLAPAHGSRARGPDRRSGPGRLRSPDPGPQHDRRVRLRGQANRDRAWRGDRPGHHRARRDRLGPGAGRSRRHGPERDTASCPERTSPRTPRPRIRRWAWSWRSRTATSAA